MYIIPEYVIEKNAQKVRLFLRFSTIFRYGLRSFSSLPLLYPDPASDGLNPEINTQKRSESYWCLALPETHPSLVPRPHLERVWYTLSAFWGAACHVIGMTHPFGMATY